VRNFELPGRSPVFGRRCSRLRRGEAWDITREYLEFGIRYVIVGSKTEASLRRLPLPDPALAFLPAKITGQLFKATPKTLGRRLLRRIRKIGISDKAKVLHSLRHRAKTSYERTPVRKTCKTGCLATTK
jgi:hypothetical protein